MALSQSAGAPAGTGVPPRRRSRLLWSEYRDGYLCIAPWLVGFLVFVAGPMVFSLGLIFTKWDILTPAQFVGVGNFTTLFQDPLFYLTLFNTTFFTVISVPLYTFFALLLALLANLPTRWKAIYRVAFFIPSQTPTVAVALLWAWIYDPQYGIANALLTMLHLPTLNWLFDPNLAKPSLIIIGLWGVGATMVVFLAGLQNIPHDVYDAASVDGANFWNRYRSITLPLLSPVILFNLIIGIIGAFQSGFSIVFVWTAHGQGPDNSILLYILYLYNNAFQYFKMGYAALLAWMLFLIVLLVTGVNFLVSRSWVYYETSGGGH